jgi:hypothetical protein
VPEALLVDGIRWGSVGPLLFISLAIMGSPAPATISLMDAGSAYGVRRSLSYLIGIIVGTTIVLLAVASCRDSSCASSRTIVQDSRYRELLRSDLRVYQLGRGSK